MTDETSDMSCDVAIIGAGTSGLAAERAARKAGARTLLIDGGFRGTLCANTGCMPSKLLIAAAGAVADLDRARTMGIDVPPARIDGRRVMKRLRSERDRFVAATRESYVNLPDGTCVRARAAFTGPDRLELDDGRKLAAKAIVIATGSTAIVPKAYRDLGPHVLTNETVFEIDDLPRSMAVIGAGPLGAELAQALARLGVQVSLFDEGDRLAKIRCDTVHDSFRDLYARDVDLHLDCAPQPSVSGDRICLSWDRNQKDFDLVLVATGRAPAIASLNLKATGLKLDDRGSPEVNPNTMQCGDSAIFMAGDADGISPLLHEASLEGSIAGSNAARYPDVVPADRPPIFTITFTDPPIAALGAPPEECALNGFADYSNQGRACVEARAGGMLRIGADAQGKLLGADLAVPGADHMAHLLLSAIMNGSSAPGFLQMPMYHPTLEEGLKPALREICHASDPSRTMPGDNGSPPGA